MRRRTLRARNKSDEPWGQAGSAEHGESPGQTSFRVHPLTHTGYAELSGHSGVKLALAVTHMQGNSPNVPPRGLIRRVLYEKNILTVTDVRLHSQNNGVIS